MSRMQQLDALRTATLKARAATADDSIGTQVKGGRIQVVRVEFNTRGKATVTPLTEWVGVTDATEFLNDLSKGA